MQWHPGPLDCAPTNLCLADQPVDIFVAAALPEAMLGAEVDRHPGSPGDLSMLCHLTPLVVGMLLRTASGIRLSAALKPSIAEVTVASFIFTSIM